MMAMLLELSGFKVATAGCVAECLRLANDLHPSAVLADVGDDEALNLPEKLRMPIIALTGQVRKRDTLHATGFAAVFIKPYADMDLRAEIDRVIVSKRV